MTGDIDVYVAAYYGTSNSFLYVNNGDGTFTSVTTGILITDPMIPRKCEWVDYDNDLDLDMFVSTSFSPSRLYRNDGAGNFTKISGDPLVSGPNTESEGGSAWGDFDNDGDLDVIIGNNGVNQFFQNNGNGTFTQITTGVIATDIVTETKGLTWVDYDNDGDLDLFIATTFGGPDNTLYENNGNANHFIDVKLTGVTTNVSAMGARIFVHTTIFGNPVSQMHEIITNVRGVQPFNQHFGLGDATTIDSLIVVWPTSGTTQKFLNVNADRFIEIREDNNTILAVAPSKPDLPPANPGIITGQVYKDEIGDCVFDGSDAGLGNQLMQATPGSYFTLTDGDGNYEFRLEPGTYTVSRVINPENIWDLQPCQTNSSYNVTVGAGDTVGGNDFALVTDVMGGCVVGVGIKHPDIITNNCTPPYALTSPCPGEEYYYCFTVTNSGNSPFVVPGGSVLQITLPSSFVITGVTSNCTIANSTLQTNTIDVTFINPIPIGTSCQVCINVNVMNTATAPFITEAVFTAGGNPFNFIVNGDFEAGFSGFSSNYNYDCLAPNIPGDFCIAVDPQPINANHRGINHTPSGSLFLFADGSTTAGTIVWQQTIAGATPLTLGENCVVNIWFDNIVRSSLNLSNPIMQVRVGGSPIISTGSINEFPDYFWNLYTGSFVALQTNPAVHIRSLSDQHDGNDFSIDDISLFCGDCVGSTQTVIVETNECACDPNNKLVSPQGCGLGGNIRRDEELSYTINFENIGGGSATDIIITDVLDNDLDISTFRIVGTSEGHTITHVQILPSNILTINFEGINLPGFQYPALNKGHVEFAIKAKSTVTDGTEITNQASIVFDRNEAVMTNVTLNTVRDNPFPVASFVTEQACSGTAQTFDFTYTGGETGANFSWEFSPNAIPPTSTDENPAGIEFASPAGFKQAILTIEKNGCISSIVDTFTVANELNLASSYALLGYEAIELGKNSVVTSGAIGVQDGDGKAEVEKGATVTGSNSWVAADELEIDEDAIVSDVYSNDIDSDGSITGTINPFSAPLVTMPDFPLFAVGNNDVEVTVTTTLQAGDYGAIEVKNNATLIFSGGGYHIEQLVADKNTKVLFNASTTLMITEDMELDWGVQFIPGNITVDASGIIVYAGKEVEIKKNATVKANIFAPNDEMDVAKNSVLKGSFIAKKIEIGKDVIIELLAGCWQPFGMNAKWGNDIKDTGEADEIIPKTIEPKAATRLQIYPNPSNETTTISFVLAKDGYAQLEIYNYIGQRVGVMYNGSVRAGLGHSVNFSTAELPNGVYFVRLRTGAMQKTSKLLIAK